MCFACLPEPMHGYFMSFPSLSLFVLEIRAFRSWEERGTAASRSKDSQARLQEIEKEIGRQRNRARERERETERQRETKRDQEREGSSFFPPGGSPLVPALTLHSRTQPAAPPGAVLHGRHSEPPPLREAKGK